MRSSLEADAHGILVDCVHKDSTARFARQVPACIAPRVASVSPPSTFETLPITEFESGRPPLLALGAQAASIIRSLIEQMAERRLMRDGQREQPSICSRWKALCA